MAICQYTCQKSLNVFITVTEVLVIGIHPKETNKSIRTTFITVYDNVIYEIKIKESLTSNSRGLDEL